MSSKTELDLFGNTIMPEEAVEKSSTVKEEDNQASEKPQKTSSSSRRKSARAYRTISEAAEILGVATHVLRFWESKFSAINPLKRGGGRRYYTPENIEVLQKIKTLLHDEGYTIKGVQAFLKRGRPGSTVQREVANISDNEQLVIKQAINELRDIRKILDA